MSLIQISQHTKDTLSKELKQRLDALGLHTESEKPSPEHYFTVYHKHTLIGFASLNVTDQVATLHNIFISEPCRGQRIGRKLALHLIAKSVKLGAETVKLKCMQANLNFFENLGFFGYNEPGMQEPLGVVAMENPCPALFLATCKQALADRRHTKLATPLILGKDTSIHHYHSERQYLALHRSLFGQARKRIKILCHSITAPVLDNNYTREAIFRLIRQNQHSEIKILLADDKTGAGRHSQTLDLAQRLSSYIEIRTLKNSGIKVNESLTLVDHVACVFRKNMTDYSGFASYDSRILAQRLDFNFEHQWQFAKPSQELRRLAI